MATEQLSGYLAHLPAFFQEDPFVGRFLLAFEHILSGRHDIAPEETEAPKPPPGLEQTIAKLHTYFIPGPGIEDGKRAPQEFLPWLASWVALSLREDWDVEEQRRLLSRIVSLYAKRGTKSGLEEMLETYTGEDAVIYEFDQPAHYFQVEITLREQDPGTLGRKEKIARAIIDQEKPAHTFYTLRVLVPTMQIENKAERDPQPTRGIWVGKTTLLGTKTRTGGAA